MKRILFVDDECELYRESFGESFGEEIEIAYCPTKDDAIKEIDSKKHFDLIILDWYLQEKDSSVFSEFILAYLYKKLFVPVFIWSHHVEDFKTVFDEGKINYPKQLIEPLSKEEIEGVKMNARIEKWFTSSITAQIAGTYRETIKKSLESVFFELAELPEGEIASILKVLVGEAGNIDWSSDFILNLIHRRLLS
ncbi:MAG TPA: hypothetical protein PLD02_04670, partial [Saprospiraceae bacterium]|nr:hypothetical protein [Saprospiraceae bacterium]